MILIIPNVRIAITNISERNIVHKKRQGLLPFQTVEKPM